jgi:hypothetical protein
MTILATLALIVLLPVAGSIVLALLGSVADHAPAPKSAGGWGLALTYVAYAYSILGAIAVCGWLFTPR